MAPIFAPLTGLHRPTPPSEPIKRAVDRLESAGGKFSVRAHTTSPQQTHKLDLLLTPSEVEDLEEFFQTVRGRWKSFWCPSYLDDLWLAADVADVDDSITIESIGYTDFLFPHESKRHLAFCYVDGTFIHRRVTASVDNGDGTETLTLASPLGLPFTRTNGGTVSWLWYGRLASDTLALQWHHGELVTTALEMIEVLGVPEVNDPECNPEVVFSEDWGSYPAVVNSAAVLAVWPATASGNADGSFIVQDGALHATVHSSNIFAGFVSHTHTLVVENGVYEVTANAMINETPGPFPGGSVNANGEEVTSSSVGVMNPGTNTVTVSGGVLVIELFCYLVPSGSAKTFSFGDITVTRVCA